MSAWVPDPASLEMEERMEEKEIPESDRDEVRRFAEFLRRRQDKKEGKDIPPAPEGMKDWLLGNDEAVKE